MKLYAGNLPHEMTEDELKELFEEYGEVVSYNLVIDHDINRSKGFGFVELANEDHARVAMKELNGKEVMGREIKIAEAKPKKPIGRGASRPKGAGKSQGFGREKANRSREFNRGGGNVKRKWSNGDEPNFNR